MLGRAHQLLGDFKLLNIPFLPLSVSLSLYWEHVHWGVIVEPGRTVESLGHPLP